jgi:hypothetical protein
MSKSTVAEREVSLSIWTPMLYGVSHALQRIPMMLVDVLSHYSCDATHL